MVDSINKIDCTGCGACANACPINAINMTTDELGFIYPKINDNCINCNKCEKICQQRIIVHKHETTPELYAAWAKNEEIRFVSTSGGVFSILAEYILSVHGKVFGAAYNKECMAFHVGISDRANISRLRQSKYIQSDINRTFSIAKESLEQGEVVLFVGTPCQIGGLYAFLGRDYEQLFTVDFICRGVNSPKALFAWKKEIEEKHKLKIDKVWFKYKEYGWKKSPRCTKVVFSNGKEVVFDGDDNLFMDGYLSYDLYTRPSCSNCRFKGVHRQSDFTLGDFWKVDKKYDDDKGTSMVLVNSSKGKHLLECCKQQLYLFVRDNNEISEGNTYFSKSVHVSRYSKEFLSGLDNNAFSQLIKKYMLKEKIRKKFHLIKKKLGR